MISGATQTIYFIFTALSARVFIFFEATPTAVDREAGSTTASGRDPSWDPRLVLPWLADLPRHCLASKVFTDEASLAE